jgi:hypothetical protein
LFLISTTHHLLAAVGIGTERPQFTPLHFGSGLYYGLATDADERIYVACRHSVVGPDDPAARAAESGAILVLNPAFRMIEELRAPFPLRDVHGIDCFDGCLWVTCAFDNMIAIYDLATGAWSQWFPMPERSDVHHFNTISLFDKDHICLVAHQWGPSQLLFYDQSTLELTQAIPLGTAAHNIFLLDGAPATCNSQDGFLVNTAGRQIETGNFPRGIALTDSGNVVGVSIHSPRHERASKDGILRWYTPDWQFQKEHLLPDVGMVLDILELE